MSNREFPDRVWVVYCKNTGWRANPQHVYPDDELYCSVREAEALASERVREAWLSAADMAKEQKHQTLYDAFMIRAQAEKGENNE